MPLGNPIRKQNESRMVSVLATEGQTVFTVQGGYIINHISVFRNGVRLSPAEDFTAGDGSTVTLNNAANIDDRIDFHIFDRFTVQNAIVSAASTQTISGDVVVNGKIFGNLDVPQINVASGIVTTHNLNVTGVTTVGKQVHVGTGVSIAAGGLNVTAGITTVQALQATTGAFTGNLTITNTAPQISLVDSDNNSDFSIYGAAGSFNIYDETNSASRLLIASDGTVTVVQGLELSSTLTIPDSIIHSGDTNTKIRFPAADTFTVETAGSERLRVNSSGVLCVGTTSPNNSATNLQVENSGENNVYIVGNTSTSGARIILQNKNTTANSFTGVLGADAGGQTTADIKFYSADNDTNEGYLTLETRPASGTPTEALRIDSSQRVMIGTTTEGQSSADDLTIATSGNTGITIRSGTSNTGNLYFSDGTSSTDEFQGFIEYSHAGSFLRFGTAATERVRIDSSGRLLLGHTSDIGYGFRSQLVGTDGNTSSSSQIRFTASASGSTFILAKSRNGTPGSKTIVQSGDNLGEIQWRGDDGVDYLSIAASINAEVDGTPGAGDMPGRLVFSTTADGAEAATERMRITSAGYVGINQTSPGTGLHVSQDWVASYGSISAEGSANALVGMGLRSNGSYEAALIWRDGSSGDYLELATQNSNPILFKTSNTERLRIDSSGNLSISSTVYGGGGTTPQLYVRGTSGRQVKIHNPNAGTCSLQMTNSTTGQGEDAGPQLFTQGGTGDFHIQNAFATGDIAFGTKPSGGSTTERMRIDSTGNTHFGSSGTLNSSNTVSIVPADGLINFGMDGRTSFVTGQNSCYIYSGEGSSGTTLAGDLILQSRSNQNRKILFVVGDGNASPTPVQKARIDQYGLYVTGTVTGKAVSASSAKAGSFDPYVFDVNGAQQSTETVSIKSQKNDCLDLTRYYTAGTIQTFRFNNDFTGRIETGTTSVTYHTSSDYRLKENAVSISDGITRLKQLKPYKFNFIKEPSVIHDGFFAHEVTPVVPTAVSGEKDATETRYYETGDVLPEGKEVGDVKEENAVLPQSLDHSKLVPLLTAALKEAITKIETLETKVAALEGS